MTLIPRIHFPTNLEEPPNHATHALTGSVDAMYAACRRYLCDARTTAIIGTTKAQAQQSGGSAGQHISELHN